MQTHEAIGRVADKVREELRSIELDVLTEGLTLAKLIREGSAVSKQAHNWSNRRGGVCALSAAEGALRARK